MALFTKFWYKSIRYEKLSAHELGSLERMNTRDSRTYHWIICSLVLLCSSIFLVLASIASYDAGSCNCHAPSDWSTPGFENFPRQNVKFVGSFESVSPYRGPPSPEVDAAWARFTVSDWVDGTAVVLGVGREEVRHAGKDKEVEWFNSTVQLGDENGGGMMASLEIFHQLHCLVRKRRRHISSSPFTNICRTWCANSRSTNTPTTRPPVVSSTSRLRSSKIILVCTAIIVKHRTKKWWHVDHCLEIIRQVLMCNADTGLITFHWIANNPVAYPDFNTWHSCRDPEEVLALAKHHAAPMRQQVRKTEKDINMPAPP
ncbi:hypothetical protein HD806DRAFT_510042 [Xylariaceae sp. AK1471]|nr:hypothetical protein HD806DRAFT_510042 [Xylariaceae sp. AK1471]